MILDSLPHHFLDVLHHEALAHRPHLDNLIRTRGTTRIQTWCRDFCSPWAHPLATSDPLFHVVYHRVARLLGASTAAALTAHLEAMPNVLTANHLGLDCYSQTLQGTLLFALARLRTTNAPPVFPVLACGNIPLNNLTYPQGLLLARTIETRSGRHETTWAPAKIPIFPRRLQHALAGSLEPFTPAMLQKARRSVQAGSAPLLDTEKMALLDLLDTVYPCALHLERFADQCTVLNARSWDRMFSPELARHIPRPVHLGLEAVCTDLLIHDLADPHSLMHALFFDPRIRDALIHALDGKVGCWARQELHTARTAELPAHNLRAGTLFFWTVDHKGGKMPMDLIQARSTARLVPVRSVPRTRDEAWTPAGITEALQCGRILPSLFTCYTVLALARNLVCHGGIYQTEYLPAIQAGVSLALRHTGSRERAEAIDRVPTTGFCSGLNLAMARYPDTTSAPAGRIECMAGGGISAEDLEKMGNMTLQEASLAALPETFAPFLPPALQSHQGQVELAARIGERLGDRLPWFDIR
jgi:hypothetical protein